MQLQATSSENATLASSRYVKGRPEEERGARHFFSTFPSALPHINSNE